MCLDAQVRAAMLAAGTPCAADADAHYAKPYNALASEPASVVSAPPAPSGCRNEMKMRKKPRAVTALTVGIVFATSVFAAQTVNNRCNRYGNIVNSDNHIVVNVDSFDHHFSKNIMVTGGSVIGSGNSKSISITH